MKTKKIQPHGLFNTKFHVEQAYQYVDDIVETLRPEDRITAYTAVYVLHNAVIKHYEDNFVCLDRHYSDEKPVGKQLVDINRTSPQTRKAHT